MQPNQLIETIETQNVIEPSGSDTYRLSDRMKSSIQSNRGELEEYLDSDSEYDVGGRQLEVSEENIDFVSNLLALEQHSAIDSFERLAKLSLVLSWFQRGVPESGESPEHFLPIHGDQLPVVLDVYSPAIVYVWRHDCDPCKIVKNDFEDIFEGGPESDVALFSVYGPDYSRWLREAHDVVGGPMTLFVVNGQIDTRLHGAHEPQLVRRELETIRERDG